MRMIKIFLKSLKEQARDWATMSLSLSLGPFFVLLYWLMIPSGSTTYGVLILNLDLGTAGSEAIAVLEELQDRDAEVMLIIPQDFSDNLSRFSQNEGGSPSTITLVGDLTNPYYAVGAIMASSALDEYVKATIDEIPPITIEEISLGASGGRSEFDLYVPGMLIISVVMLVFIVSMTITYEVESGTLQRLLLTRMTAFDLLAGISLSTVLLGVTTVLLTFSVALILGFESLGPVWAAMLIGAITAISVVGVGLIVAAFSKTVSQAFIIANFPLIFFMFFSGAIYPLPRIPLLEIGGKVISIYDVIPSTHSVVALNKVLTLGGGFSTVLYELLSLIVLSILFYGFGIWLFHRRHMRLQ